MSKRINTAVWLDKYQRWQINVQKDGKRKTFTSSKPGRSGQRECNRKADAWLDADIVKAGIKVKDLWAQMVEELKLTTGRGHWEHYEQYWRNYIGDRIGNKRVSAVTEQDLQSIITYAHAHPKSGRPLSRKTLGNIREVLVHFITYARKSKVTTLRPEGLTIPQDAPRPAKRTMQPDDLRKLFACDNTLRWGKAVPEWYRFAYRFAVLTGLRPGELYHLAWRDVDLSSGLCKITGAINKYHQITTGKNDNAIREFIMPDMAVQVLRDQKQMLTQAGIISPWVFPEEDGEITRQSRAYKDWLRYRNHNNISPISCYEMRHTFFSANKRLPPELVKMIGGHSDMFDTFGTYGHLLDGEKKQAAAMVNSVFSDILK